ncbi:hypothetical protein MOUN0_D06260 [Monosporozyma unispora]
MKFKHLFPFIIGIWVKQVYNSEDVLKIVNYLNEKNKRIKQITTKLATSNKTGYYMICK